MTPTQLMDIQQRAQTNYADCTPDQAILDVRTLLGMKHPTERSCYTCKWCGPNSVCQVPIPDTLEGADLDLAIDQYGVIAGCIDNMGGMPTDRTIICPGHEPR